MRAMTSEKTKKAQLFTTNEMVTVGLLSALAYVLMLVHFPFKYLGFLELEFSDIPAIIGGLVYGPVAGVTIELIKNGIKVLTASTTGGVGELANFLISIAYVIPVSILYRKIKGKKKVVISFGAGMLGMIIAGIVVNYYITIPLYARLYGGMDTIVELTSGTIPAIKGLGTIIILGITPFNVVKSLIMSVVGYYTYKLFRNSLSK
jgi:riboflavin transporter